MNEHEANGHDPSEQEEFEWSVEERETLRAMAEEMPGAEERAAALEERTVRHLRRQDLLGAPRAARIPRTIRGGRWAIAAAILLALLPAVFLAGMVTGQRTAARDTAEAFAAAFDDDALAAAARVQETGSAHVTALVALGALDATQDPVQVAQGREAARAALYAAAVQLARLDPEDPLARRLVRILEAMETPREEGEEERQVVWF